MVTFEYKGVVEMKGETKAFGPNGVRYFTDLTGWKIEVLNANGTSTEPVPAPPEVPDVPVDAGDPEDLPF